ncbi:acyltransferase family protein [Vibrio splendidus]|uniref:acyltransferase family protein n=1 Tax=Vibrio splendidus TaxID=29497 RepID=UPI000E32D206|nr:acyltransferase family protein [Vibrio splendidus]
MKFRYDINALRALAVIAVVIFHFEPTWLEGGFAGVDVFFVISGYLMTGIIMRRMANDSFSLLDFYTDRATRIIPALAALCVSLLIFSFFFLTPFDYPTIANHVISSILFYSNYFYLGEAGYFDVASNEKWLLHTWSLSVEWQFYILFPILLIFLNKFISTKNVGRLIGLCALFSFGYSLYLSRFLPDTAYFSLASRAWEMLAGGIAFFIQVSGTQKKLKLYQSLGFALIILSYLLIDKTMAWPSELSLFPVIGTMLVLISKVDTGRVINNRMVQSVGSSSYSIYLWHWPIVVYGNYFTIDSWWILGFPLSILAGYLSYKFIELNKLGSKNGLGKITKLKSVMMIFIVLFSGHQLSTLDYRGGAERDNRLYKSALSAIGDWNFPKPNLNINGLNIRYIEGYGDENILFIGASHTEQTYPYIKANNQEYNIYYLTMAGCSMAPSAAHPRWSCENIQRYKELFKEVQFKKVVTSSYCIFCSFSKGDGAKELRLKEYDDFLRYTKSHSDELYIILREPVGEEFDPKKSVRYRLPKEIPIDQIRERNSRNNEVLNALSELHGVKFIDPVSYLCSDVCKTTSDEDEFYYKDKSHMRPWYSEKYLGYLDVIIK